MAKVKTAIPVNKRQVHEQRLRENLVAISAVFHGNETAYKRFYDANAERLSGFPGIWRHVVELGEAFSEADVALVEEWIDGWIEAVEVFATQSALGPELLTRSEAYQSALDVIRRHCHPDGLYRQGKPPRPPAKPSLPVRMKSNAERAKLARRVYEEALQHTASFEIGNVGADLAYLTGAILTDGTVQFTAQRALMQILRRRFKPNHPVWAFVEILQ